MTCVKGKSVGIITLEGSFILTQRVDIAMVICMEVLGNCIQQGIVQQPYKVCQVNHSIPKVKINKYYIVLIFH